MTLVHSTSADMANFGPNTTAAAVVSIFADQVQGRTFLINGVSLGAIGAEIAISLAKAGPARLVLVDSTLNGNDLQHISDEIKRRDASIAVTIVTTNFSSISSVQNAGLYIQVDPDIAEIDVMINIPTVMPRSYTKTEDGLEYLLQSNYLSHFILTKTILPKILSTKCPRIVNVSSSANKISGIRWHDLNFEEPGSYEPWTAYGQTKTAAVLFTVALNKRLVSAEQPNFRSYVVHPGGVKSKLQEELSKDALSRAFEGTKKRFGEETAKEFFRWKTLAAASSTPLRAALDPLLLNRQGFWLEDCELLEKSVHLDTRATDISEALRLWDMSEELIRKKTSS